MPFLKSLSDFLNANHVGGNLAPYSLFTEILIPMHFNSAHYEQKFKSVIQINTFSNVRCDINQAAK